MSQKGNENCNGQSANVLHLGFNISVSGSPNSDFQIVLDEKGNKALQSYENELQFLPSTESPQLEDHTSQDSKNEVENSKTINSHDKLTDCTIYKSGDKIVNETAIKTDKENSENSSGKDDTIIKDIKNTMEHFERFSDHIKEVPRFKSYPTTSTPFSDKSISKSESNLIYQDSYRPRRFPHLYDYHYKNSYFKGATKPLPSDLYLKPLPGENFYKKGIVSRYFDVEPYRHYSSVEKLTKSINYKSSVSFNSNHSIDKYELEHYPSGILKKSDSESGDKQSTSSADSVKDIKIYQSGGIIIMQNFKENFDMDKKKISEISAKLIENCNKMKEDIDNEFLSIEEKTGNSSDEVKNLVKTVQFDLSGCDNRKSKLEDSSPDALKDEYSVIVECSESASDCKNKDTSSLGTSQSQDFPSLSTQENDSLISNLPGMSPTYTTSGKKLEWDSGADVGYLNLDISKENLSTIERIVLKGLSSDGTNEKRVIYEKKRDQSLTNRSNFVLERIPSELIIKGTVESENISDQQKELSLDKKLEKVKRDNDSNRNLPQEEVQVKDSPFAVLIDESGSKASKPLTFEKQNVIKNTPEIEEIPENQKFKKKTSKTFDKSVNVNTLFNDENYQVLDLTTKPNESKRSEVQYKYRSSRLSPKVKKLKKKKSSTSKTFLTAPLKNKIESIRDKVRCSNSEERLLEMGIPKHAMRKFEGNPELSDLEMSREIEEIVIDQRFKTEENLVVDEEDTKESTKVTLQNAVSENIGEGEIKKKALTKCRPISASSSSNNTVLPNIETKNENNKNEAKTCKCTSQIIQNREYRVESIGVQAFSSPKIRGLKSINNVTEITNKPKSEKDGVCTSSKNVQVFGLNSSLPRQLVYPKEAKIVESQNTKSTQFFGGPINSLPNYHSNLITKPVESCGRMPKVLKSKKNIETEIIRLNEENKKNIMVNDSERNIVSNKPSEDLEDKENLIIASPKSSKKNDSEGLDKKSLEVLDKKYESRSSTESMIQKKSLKEVSLEVCCDLQKSEVSSTVLTREVLRDHGDSIDRNIIQEKYFQSQLVEIEKREMLSKSTSIDRQLEHERTTQTTLSLKKTAVGCQYSPQSKDNSSEERLKSGHNPKKVREQNKCKQSLEENDSDQILPQEIFSSKRTHKEQDFGNGDSLPSSTQTAYSWMPGMQNPENIKSGIGRARSFEYLPGHIYESSGNLREELPSETDHNLVTGSSLISSDSDIQKASVSNGTKDSEGATDTPSNVGTENKSSIESRNCDKSSSITSSKLRFLKSKKVGKETSKACQTEEKCSLSEPVKFFEEKKALEKRISEEKESQIKWIENEIQHLNILRGLLEQQNLSTSRKKKNSVFSLTSNEGTKSEEKYPKNILAEVYSRPVTPVYGCTISLENKPPEGNKPTTYPENSPGRSTENESPAGTDSKNFGMALSFTGGCKSLRQVVMLPVGVQVTLKDINLQNECSSNEPNNENVKVKPNSQTLDNTRAHNSAKDRLNLYNDVNTQFPSIKRMNESNRTSSPRSDIISVKGCGLCQQENCVCLDLPEKSDESASRTSKYNNHKPPLSDSLKTSFERNPKIVSENQEYKHMSPSTDAVIQEIQSYETSKANRRDSESSENKLESMATLSKNKTNQSSVCRCENCPSRVQAIVSKPTLVCHGPCQSRIFLDCEKASDNYVGCHCSKFQVQKSSNCGCHVIKIQGPKYCKSEIGGTCSCRRRPSLKKMENQFCQTDEDLLKNVENVKLVSHICDSSKSETRGNDKVVEEKTSFSSSVIFDNRQACSPKIGIQGKSVLEKKVLSESIPLEVKTPVPVVNCSCQTTENKNKSKNDDHPRHYFLKIEETEVDDSNESSEQKCLEVITVTVPIKKTGKATFFDNKVNQSRPSSSQYKRSEKVISNCNCCEEYIGRTTWKPCNDYKATPTQEYQKNKPQPAESSEMNPKLSECDSYDKIDFYGKFRQKDINEKISPREFYKERGKVPQPYVYDENCYFNENSKGFNRDVEMTSSGETHSDYDSHKECRKQNTKDQYYNDRRYYNEEYKTPSKASNVNKKNYEPCKNNDKGFNRPDMNLHYDQFDSEYFNYDKKEYMTRSELLREEERQKKCQPSLQEFLASNRPDFFNNAEARRQIISDRSKERLRRYNNRMECLVNLFQNRPCNEICPSKYNNNLGPKRIFTSSQMREQTMKRYRNLPEVTGKIADEKKKEEYRTNRIMADIYAKKLQLETLKGHLNLSNSVYLLSTI